MKFDKRILASMLMIALLSAVVGAGTIAYFSDTETITAGSDFLTMGTLDITIGTVSKVKVDKMVPCDTATITFPVLNSGSTVAVDVWVRITDVVCGPGGAETEPEAAEPGPRDWLAPFVIYDLKAGSTVIVADTDNIRVDNAQEVWVKTISGLGVMGSRNIELSFHLRTWPDYPLPEVTNWAQGDTMDFDVEVYAVQVGEPCPQENILMLYEKNPVTWEIVSGASGILDIAAKTFTTTGLVSGTSYELIYYADPWPGTGGHSIRIATGAQFNAGQSGLSFGTIPAVGDDNFAVGGKIMLVLDSHYDGNKMVAWSPSSYLFDEHLINP